MKQKFSTTWKASKQTRKQRKFRANAPFHTRNKFLTAPLSSELVKANGIKKIPVRTGDKVKVMVGQNKGFEGKVERVYARKSKIYIEKMRVSKKDGSEVAVPIHASNVMITALNTDDKRRLKKKSEKKVTERKIADKNVAKSEQKETKEVKKENNEKIVLKSTKKMEKAV